MYAENCVNRIIKNLLKVYVTSGSMLKLTLHTYLICSDFLNFLFSFGTYIVKHAGPALQGRE